MRIYKKGSSVPAAMSVQDYRITNEAERRKFNMRGLSKDALTDREYDDTEYGSKDTPQEVYDRMYKKMFPLTNATWELSEKPSGMKPIVWGLLITTAFVLSVWFCIATWGYLI